MSSIIDNPPCPSPPNERSLFSDQSIITWRILRSELANRMTRDHLITKYDTPDVTIHRTMSGQAQQFLDQHRASLELWTEYPVGTGNPFACREHIASYQTARCHWTQFASLDYPENPADVDNGQEARITEYICDLVDQYLCPFAQKCVMQDCLAYRSVWPEETFRAVMTFLGAVRSRKESTSPGQTAADHILVSVGQQGEETSIAIMEFKRWSVYPDVCNQLHQRLAAAPPGGFVDILRPWNGQMSESARAMVGQVAEQLHRRGVDEGLLTGLYGHQYLIKLVSNGDRKRILCTRNLASTEVQMAARNAQSRMSMKTNEDILDYFFPYLIRSIRAAVTKKFGVSTTA